MTIKETYCSVTNLLPNTQYEFWVTAQNRAGLSPTSERAVYMTGKGPLVGPSLKGTQKSRLSWWGQGFGVTWKDRNSLALPSFYLVHQICMPDMAGTFFHSWSQKKIKYCPWTQFHRHI